jgi:putative holliday junction resolvase
MKILAVDHGSTILGLAISDPTGTIARPLITIRHTGRLMDAAAVAEQAQINDVDLIVIGVSYNDSGQPNASGRSTIRFAEALKSQLDLPIEYWDESFTTQDARQTRILMRARRKDRSGHLDDLAAALLLQSYIDAHLNKVNR